MKHEHAILIGKGILTILAALVPFFLLYLTAAFINWSFDAGKWFIDARILVGAFGFIGGCIAGGLAATALHFPKVFQS